MLGVRRTSVSLIASTLQAAGLIRYRRGHVHIVDAEGLKEAACECHDVVRANYDLLLDAKKTTRTRLLSAYSREVRFGSLEDISRRYRRVSFSAESRLDRVRLDVG